MKYRIEYSGGPTDNTWHGHVIVEAASLPQALQKVQPIIECTPAAIDAVFPEEDTPDPPAIRSGFLWTGNEKLDRLRSRAASDSTGTARVSIEELNQILPLEK